MKPLFMLLDTTNAKTHVIDPGGEYPLWMLLPEGLDSTSDTIRRTFRYQHELIVMASKLLPESGCFVDAGAGIGAWTVQLGKLRPKATIYAFEPCRPLFLALATNVLLNGLHNVHLDERALGMERHDTVLCLPAHDLSSATLRSYTDGPTLAAVRVVALDDPEVFRGRVSLMKIHVTGSEANVLAGAKLLIERERPAIFLQIPDPKVRLMRHPDAARVRDDVMQMLAALGYDTLELFPEHYLAAPEKELKRVTRKARA